MLLQCCVYLASDGGRACRPFVIADKGVSRIKEHHMEELEVTLMDALYITYMILITVLMLFILLI